MGARLALGTAQFGSNYGVKCDGQPSALETAKILQAARQAGIDMVDTAPIYGRMPDFSGFAVVTKTPYNGASDPYAVLVHSPDNLTWHSGGMWWLLDRGHERGFKVGVSVYTPEQLERFLEYPIGIVQFPLSIVDGRFLPYIPRLRDRGIEVHARSVFLQGALLMDDPPVPVPRLDVERCLGFALAQDVDRVIVGVNSEAQLWEILQVAPDYDLQGWQLPIEVIDPRRWGFDRARS